MSSASRRFLSTDRLLLRLRLRDLDFDLLRLLLAEVAGFLLLLARAAEDESLDELLEEEDELDRELDPELELLDDRELRDELDPLVESEDELEVGSLTAIIDELFPIKLIHLDEINFYRHKINTIDHRNIPANVYGYVRLYV